MKTQLLIPAAGMGLRLGADGPKALVDLAGKPILAHTLERFRPLGLLETAVILVPPEQIGLFESALASHFLDQAFTYAEGGAERQHSVENGLAALDADTDIVAIHDAARAFIGAEAVQASIDAAAECGASTVAVPSVDTILVSDDEGFLADTPDRSKLWACQTPQTFRLDVIRSAHRAAREHGYLGTDDATLVMRAGGKVKLVPGSPQNFKITTPEDLERARLVVEQGLV